MEEVNIAIQGIIKKQVELFCGYKVSTEYGHIYSMQQHVIKQLFLHVSKPWVLRT